MKNNLEILKINLSGSYLGFNDYDHLVHLKKSLIKLSNLKILELDLTRNNFEADDVY